MLSFVFNEQKTAVASLPDKEVMPCSTYAKEWRFENKANRSLPDNEFMPCSAFAKEWRFKNKANRSFVKTKGATPPR